MILGAVKYDRHSFSKPDSMSPLETHPKDKTIIISIESRKGGIGKTSVALNLAAYLVKEKGYDVLFLDLDLTGTSVSRITTSFLWKDVCVSIIKEREGKNDRYLDGTGENAGKEAYEKANLFDLYLNYYSLDEIRSFRLLDKKPDEHKVYVIGSMYEYTPLGGDKKEGYSATPPEMLLGEMHVRWIVDFVKKTAAAFEDACRNKSRTDDEPRKVAVIIDNSPGYNGVTHQLHEWLTDLGPDIGKIVTVTSLECQDISACAESIRQIEEMYKLKKTIAKAYSKQKKSPETVINFSQDAAASFLLRLIEHDRLHPGAENSDANAFGDKSKERIDCKDLLYYMRDDDIQDYLATDIVKYQGCIVNRVPWTLKQFFVDTGNVYDSHATKEQCSLEELFKGKNEGIANLLLNQDWHVNIKWNEFAKHLISVKEELAFADLESNLDTPGKDSEPFEAFHFPPESASKISMLMSMRNMVSRILKEDYEILLESLKHTQLIEKSETIEDVVDGKAARASVRYKFSNEGKKLADRFIGLLNQFHELILSCHRLTGKFGEYSLSNMFDRVADALKSFRQGTKKAIVYDFISLPDDIKFYFGSIINPKSGAQMQLLNLCVLLAWMSLQASIINLDKKTIMDVYLELKTMQIRDIKTALRKNLIDRSDAGKLNDQQRLSYEKTNTSKTRVSSLLLRLLNMPGDVNLLLYLAQGTQMQCENGTPTIEEDAKNVILFRKKTAEDIFNNSYHFDRVTETSANEFKVALEEIVKTWKVDIPEAT